MPTRLHAATALPRTRAVISAFQMQLSARARLHRSCWPGCRAAAAQPAAFCVGHPPPRRLRRANGAIAAPRTMCSMACPPHSCTSQSSHARLLCSPTSSEPSVQVQRRAPARLSRPLADTASAGGTSRARVLTRDAVLWRAEQSAEERRSGATRHGGGAPLCMPSACELRWLGARFAALGGLLVSVETPVRTSAAAFRAVVGRRGSRSVWCVTLVWTAANAAKSV
jgi:hypothetical protein